MSTAAFDRPVRLAALATLAAFAGCAVPIRYAVPARQLVGREVIGKTVHLGETPADAEPVKIVEVESDDGAVLVQSGDPEAHARVQALVARAPQAEAVLTSDDTRSWPSIVGGIAAGQVGFVIGEVYVLASEEFGRGNNEAQIQRLLTSMAYGAVIGTFAGIGIGSMLAGRVKVRQVFDPPAVRFRAPPIAAPAPPPPPPASLPVPPAAAVTPVQGDVLQPPPPAPLPGAPAADPK
ncbi:MAG: hypothetical protein FJ100_02035 [Deltaproteobacteria bacterium]|nr:hypothetical protein [Deltaproteobacteria bacterium]